MVMHKPIKSESQFMRAQFFLLLKLPITFFNVLLKKQKPEELARPFTNFGEFIAQPKVTFWLIMVNILVFFVEIFLLTEEQIMAFVFQPGQLLQFKIYPMFASWFLHASLAHLAANILALFIFGRVVEMHFGRKKMLMIYFGSAIISSLFAALFGQGGIGASGAIAGVIAVAILYKPFYFTYIALGTPIPIIIIGWLSIISDITGVLVPKNDNIGHFAHLGGYIAVSFLTFFFDSRERKKLLLGLIVNILFVAAIGLLFFLLG